MKQSVTKSKQKRQILIAVAVLAAAVVAGVLMLLFTGDITVTLGESSLQVQAAYYGGVEVPYEEFDNVQLRQDFDFGTRVEGFGSPRLSLGVYKNGEYEYYNLYAYTGAKSAVILTSGQKTLVLACRTEAETQALYESLLQRIG